jgi:cytochrome c peroxidase
VISRDNCEEELSRFGAEFGPSLLSNSRQSIKQKMSRIAIGVFRQTPGLRNVPVTGPYFHNGSMQTLWDVMNHYNKGDGISDPWLDKGMQPLALTEPEIGWRLLTSPQYKEVGDQEYARQLAPSKVSRPQRDTARAFGPKPKQPGPPSF